MIALGERLLPRPARVWPWRGGRWAAERAGAGKLARRPIHYDHSPWWKAVPLIALQSHHRTLAEHGNVVGIPIVRDAWAKGEDIDH